ncbi:MAG: hypothetical protein AAB425_03640, partial [Bdellovibrionota bacterium]
TLTTDRLDRVTVAALSLVFEGAGLHYLQDILSAGHLRAVHDRRGLSERRYDHDRDNADGVIAVLNTKRGEHRFVSYGDSYLLGPPALPSASELDCRALTSKDAGKSVSDCLIRHQRGLLVAISAGSLLEWATGEAPRIDVMPVQAPRALGSLPTPAPPFHYESLAVHFSVDAVGRGNQIGLDTAYFSELGTRAGWLTSHRIGFRSSLGGGDQTDPTRFAVDYAYGFHWRWAARFIVDGEPFVFLGIKNAAPRRDFYLGLGPRLGITILPEGWVKIPLELSLSYRLPMILVKKFEIEAHWVQASLGLAFM